ncbi:DUF2914 domain-containing protein [Rheinheimera sp. 4Y26]|uniref:DUF2914 domain-containing protein n=1 Tax=Rheinheimera sp. 4Y26 TaxID=2977811 RepID=UPI0021B0B45C|nr:DUF2914 domain-containing protein [Rheinheimera sp. 4Y26]MCT6698261.1 DUF2914 domain-containing protein [Rheinheimera sp. 4Y26]
MSEQSAKLRVKVTLHRDLPVPPPAKLQYAKAPLSKTRLLFATGLLLLAALGFWQYWVSGTQSEQSADTKLSAELNAEVVPQADLLNNTAHVSEAEQAALANKADTETTETAAVGASTAQNSPAKDDSTAPATEDLTENTAENSPENTAQLSPAAQSNNSDIKNSAVLLATSAQAMPKSSNATGTLAPQSAAEPQTTAVATDNLPKLPDGFSRIVLAADMEQLEPGRPVAQLVAKKDIQRLYLFTELKGYAGQQLKHRWSFNGVVQTEALLTIEDSPWRTYSEKWLLPDQLGAWRVEIIDQQQNVLYSHDFQYQ